jgi:hypothetical protein
MAKETASKSDVRTEQTPLGTSYADRGCQTESVDHVDTTRIDRGCQTDSAIVDTVVSMVVFKLNRVVKSKQVQVVSMAVVKRNRLVKSKQRVKQKCG